MTPKRSLWRSIAGVCLLIATIVCCAALAANLANGAEEEAQQDQQQQQREHLLAQMRGLAEKTQVRYQQGQRQPQLVASPVFRYDDKPRHFLDATMWVWTDGGRPAAFEKIEAVAEEPPMWSYCFTSVSDKLLMVKWGRGRQYRSTAPAGEFHLLPETPAPPTRSATRKLQARKVARDFSARILTDARANTSEEMRLLPTPIFEYSVAETNSFLGAVFGLATSGTNPDILILLEARDAKEGESAWHYAVARMTAGGVKVKYRAETVWEAEYCPPVSSAFPTWTFFNVPRTPLADASAEAGVKSAAANPASDTEKAD